MTTVDAIIDWITSEEKLDLFFMSRDSDLLESFLLKKPENVGRVFTIKQIKEHEKLKQKYPKLILDSDNISSPFVMFNDYEGTHVVIGNNELSYSKTIEWNRLFRKYCRRIMNFRYTGPKIIDGFWSDENIETYDNIRYLGISKWGNMCQKLPIPDPKLSISDKVFDIEKSTKYISDLKVFLRTLFTILLEDEQDTEDIINAFVSENAMITWTQAFIHITQNATYNNDSLEHRGDRVFHGDFGRYMHDKFPGINSHEGSSFHHQYLSKTYQTVWSDDLNLIDRLIKNQVVQHSQKTKTDCIESFLGAMDEIGSRIQNGLNYVVVSKFLYTLNDSIPFNKDLKFGISKHKITQINESLGFRKGDIVVVVKNKGTDERGDFSILVSQVINPNLIKFFTDKTNEINLSGGSTLMSIFNGSIMYKYHHSRISTDDAYNEVWRIISDIYDSYDLSLTTTKNKVDPIFEKIKRYDSPFYENLTKSLFEEYPEVNNSLLPFSFIVNREENFVIFYIRKPETESKSNTNMAEDYQKDIVGLITYKNISVVPFINKSYSLGNHLLTTVESCKYNSLKTYLMNCQ